MVQNASANTDVIRIRSDLQKISISPRIQYFEDKTNSYTFDYLSQRMSVIPWKDSNQEHFNFGFSDSTFWLYGEILNADAGIKYLVFDIGDALVNQADLYFIREDGSTVVRRIGTQRAPIQAISGFNFAGATDLQVNEKIRFYIRLKSNTFLQAPLTIWDAKYYVDSQVRFKLAVGLFSGVFIMMTCYLLFLYIHLREAKLVQYILFICCYLSVIWIVKGFDILYQFDFIASNYETLLISLMGGVCLNLSLLAPQLLKLKDQLWFSVSSRTLVVSSCVVIFSPLFVSYKVSIILFTILIACITLVSLICGLFYMRGESNKTRFYMFCMIYFVLGIDILLLNRYNVLEQNRFIEYSSAISAILVMVFLCWNFAKRMASEQREKNQAQQQFTSVNERYYSVFQNAAEGMFTTTLNGDILAINKTMCKLLGYINLEDLRESGNVKANDFYADPNQRAQIMDKLRSEGEVNSVEMTGFNRYGEKFHGEINMRLNVQPEMTVIDGSFVDTTRRKENELELQYLAKYDQLTGLVNRGHFEQVVKAALSSSTSVVEDKILLYMDLDQFKLVNDICGHGVGDSLLKKVTVVLQSFLEPNAVLARLGGDEFALLIEHASFDYALELADTIRSGIEDFRFVHNGRHFVLGISIGIVVLDDSIKSFSQALSLADTACYTAKKQGRNRVHVYSKSNDVMQGHQKEMRWIGVLREALDQNRFELAFQTIEPLCANEKGYRYEILLRLRDENGVLQSPSEFIAAAENYNFMSQLDRWVVKTYCQWLSSNPRHMEKLQSASINLCGQSLVDRGMHSFIEQTLLTYAIPPAKLCFEVTESQAIMDFDQTVLFMQKFKELGCRFSLDDFGSGFSSYSYIKRLPIDQLKIDGAFVKNIETDAVDYTMVKSFHDIAKAVNIKTVAEYVENENIKQILTEIGIDYVQGYLIAKPALLVDLIENELFDTA